MRTRIIGTMLGIGAILSVGLTGCTARHAEATPDNGMMDNVTSTDAASTAADAMSNATDAMAIPTPPDEDGRCTGPKCLPAKAKN